MAGGPGDWPVLAHQLRLYYEGERDAASWFAGSRGLYTFELRRLPSPQKPGPGPDIWRGSVAHPRLPADLLLLDVRGADPEELPPATGRTGDPILDEALRIAGAPGKTMAALDEPTRELLRAQLPHGTFRMARGRIGFELVHPGPTPWPESLPGHVEAALALARRLVQVLLPLDLVEMVRCHPDPEVKLAYLEVLLELSPDVLERLPPEIHGLELTLLVRRVRAAKDRRGQLSLDPGTTGALSPAPSGRISLLRRPIRPPPE
ncbi:MAG: hypothetical protein IPG45_00780 [Deltaproteobacteria bacterium]|nr:hypothetical protein [Deltaproteobacteria bacterium]